ncbi:MAG: MFS transporter [Pseudomonadota bacterium]
MKPSLHRFSGWFLIRPHEVGVAWYLFAVMVLMGAGLGIGKGVNEALFLKRVGVDNLPMVYILVSPLMLVAGLGYSAVVDRIAPERLFRVLFAVLGVALLGLWWSMGVKPGADLPYTALFLVYEIASDLLVVHATFYISQTLNLAQSKRLTAFVLAGVQIGMLCGGIFLGLFLNLFAVTALLGLWIVFLAGGWTLLFFYHRYHGASPFYQPRGARQRSWKAATAELGGVIRYAGRVRLLRVLAGGLVFTVIGFYALHYLTNRVFAASFATEAELGQFLGWLIAFNSAVGLGIQLLVTNRLLERFGLRVVNMIFPTAMLLSSGLLAASFTLPFAVLGSFTKDALMNAVRNPSYSLFFQALPPAMQGRSRALMVGLVIPLALAITGGILHLTVVYDALGVALGVALAASLAFVVFSLRSNVAYRETLVSTLNDAVFLGSRGGALSGRNDSVLTQLEQGIASDIPTIVLSYARKMVDWFPESAADSILARMPDKDIQVRIELAELLAPLGVRHLETVLWETYETAGPEERALVLRLLLRTGAEGASKLMEELKDSPHPLCQALWLWRRLETEAGVDADALREKLLHWARSSEGDEQQAALLVLHELGDLGPHHEAIAALMSAQKTPTLVATLDLVRDRGTTALLAMLRPRVEQLLDHGDHGMRLAALRLLVRLDPVMSPDFWRERLIAESNTMVMAELIKGWAASGLTGDQVTAFVTGTDTPFRSRLEVLRVCGDEMLSGAQLEGLMEGFIGNGRKFAAVYSVLDDDPASQGRTLLRTVMLERVEQMALLAMEALKHLENAEAVNAVAAALGARDARYHDYALEVLNTMHHRMTGRNLVALLEFSKEPEHGPGWNEWDKEEALLWCERSGDGWLRRCLDYYRQDADRKRVPHD